MLISKYDLVNARSGTFYECISDEPFLGEGNKYHYVYIIRYADSKYIGIHSTDNLFDKYKGSGASIQTMLGGNKEILMFCESRKEALDIEKDLICVKMIKRSDILNRTPGGGGVTGHSLLGVPLSEERKRKMSIIMRGRPAKNPQNKDLIKIAKTAESHRGMKRNRKQSVRGAISQACKFVYNTPLGKFCLLRSQTEYGIQKVETRTIKGMSAYPGKTWNNLDLDLNKTYKENGWFREQFDKNNPDHIKILKRDIRNLFRILKLEGYPRWNDRRQNV